MPQGGSVRQLAGSAPIRSPRSASSFIDFRSNGLGLGGTHPSGTATNRTSTSAPYFTFASSASRNTFRMELSVAARVAAVVLFIITFDQRGCTVSGGHRTSLLKMIQYRILGTGAP